MSYTQSQKRLILFAALVYLLLVIVSVACLALKRDSLGFQTRDYNYFIEQAVRLTDPQMSKRFALNIEGYNFIGLRGTEGVTSLVQAIHTEYFRYTYAALYGLFHSTLVIYIFYCLVFFSPLLYVALIPRPPGKLDWLQAALFILLFVFLPATLPAVTSDLRPRMLFGSAWCLAALSVYYERPFWEKLILFLFLVTIREEGILLGAIILLLNFFWMRGKPGWQKQTLVFLALCGLGLVGFVWFMRWGGYTVLDRTINPLNNLLNWLPALIRHYPKRFLIVGTALLVITIGGLWWKWRSQPARLNLLWNGLALLAYLVALAMTGYVEWGEIKHLEQMQPPGGSVGPLETLVHLITDPVSSLFFFVFLPLLVLPLSSLRGRVRWAYTGGLLALVILLAGVGLNNFFPQVQGWQQELPAARLVWQLVNKQDRYQTDVLVDYATYQAFYAYDKVIVYNRLPAWMVDPDSTDQAHAQRYAENRYYPQNQEILVKLIRDQIEYAVIARESLPDVQGVIQQAGVQAVEVASNQRYVVLKLK